MNANKNSMDQDWVDADEAPDMSSPEWVAKFEAGAVKRGRPRAKTPKVSTTLRLDADVVDGFRARGKGWQSAMNEALRQSLGLR